MALTGGPARLFLTSVLLINVARNLAVILDGFITQFNPKLPNDWLGAWVGGWAWLGVGVAYLL